MTRVTFVLALVVFFASTHVEAAKPILNITDEAIPLLADGSPRSLDDVQKTIIEACSARRWVPEVIGDTRIRATINVRGKHTAELEISYSSTAYSITYSSSDNLDYNEKRQRIHRNYNNWVLKLSGTINKNFLTVSGTSESSFAGAKETNDKNQGDTYSELAKLEDLRERGILTDDEFQAEKRKLLERN